MNPRNVYTRLAAIIADARNVADEIGDAELETKLRSLEIMTLDRLYTVSDGLDSGSPKQANRKQGRMKREGMPDEPPSAMKQRR